MIIAKKSGVTNTNSEGDQLPKEQWVDLIRLRTKKAMEENEKAAKEIWKQLKKLTDDLPPF